MRWLIESIRVGTEPQISIILKQCVRSAFDTFHDGPAPSQELWQWRERQLNWNIWIRKRLGRLRTTRYDTAQRITTQDTGLFDSRTVMFSVAAPELDELAGPPRKSHNLPEPIATTIFLRISPCYEIVIPLPHTGSVISALVLRLRIIN